MSSPSVVIAVPLSRDIRLGASEELSLRHLEHFLPNYPKRFIAPTGTVVSREGFETIHFPSSYFGSVKAHNRLLLSPLFYRSLAGYDYLLIHHLDALVFSSELDFWCAQGFDLIAPPWIPGPEFPWLKEPGVGNGGFSLRRIDAFLKVLTSKRLWREPESSTLKPGPTNAQGNRLRRVRDLWLRWYRLNGVNQEIRRHIDQGWNEDRFWWKRGRWYYPEFQIAPLDVALRFGFEANPRRCMEMSGGFLPFGCHAWEKYDRAFWEPYLLQVGVTR